MQTVFQMQPFFELLVGCRPALGYSQGDNFINPMLITAF